MNLKQAWKNIGPGLVVAATGLGAGDIVAAAVAGAQFGTTLVWVALAGGLLKFCLNEGIGRWQLVTGTTLLEGWIRHLPPVVTGYFFLYLLLWSFMVSAAMMAATGLGTYALWPILSVQQWGALFSIVTLAIVWSGKWALVEGLMKFCIALMFVTVLGCAVLVIPDAPGLLADAFRPSIPEGSVTTVVSVMGGVGGSVTIMSYGYWMREAGWKGSGMLATMRCDLGVSYALTALFAACVVMLGAGVRPEVIQGNGMAVAFAEQLVPYTGQIGKWLFLIGFWGAVWSSMLGVWHGVPYLFANFVAQIRGQTTNASEHPAERANSGGVSGLSPNLTCTREYRGFLLYMALLPMILLVVRAPVQVVRLYTIAGAMFIPLLAILLLYLNRPRWIGEHANGRFTQACLGLCLVLFVYLLFTAPSA